MSLFLIPIVLAIFIGNVAFNFVNNSTKLKKDLLFYANLSAVRLSQNLAQPIWEVNEKAIENTVVSEMVQKEIVAVKVFSSANDSILLQRSRDNQGSIVHSKTADTANTVITSKDIYYNDGVIGKVFLYSSTKFIAKEKRAMIGNALLTAIVFTIVLTVVIHLSITNIINRPIRSIMHGLQDLIDGEGDLTRRLSITDNDEMGKLSLKINQLLQRLQEMIKQVYEASHIVSSSASTIKKSLDTITVVSEDVSDLSSKTSITLANTKNNVNTISENANSMSGSVSSTAATISEINNSINEISRNCQHESQTAAHANKKSEETKNTIVKLEDGAKNIGKIIEVINSIADQTNLLALNATIEAATAGESGKGFAVVANEIKELSKQTRKSTEEIEVQVHHVQNMVITSSDAINEIYTSVLDVNNIAQIITAAVEEQSATVNEINKNLANAANSATAIAKNIKETANNITNASHNTENVSKGVQSTAQEIAEITSNAKLLKDQSDKLNAIISKFRI